MGVKEVCIGVSLYSLIKRDPIYRSRVLVSSLLLVCFCYTLDNFLHEYEEECPGLLVGKEGF